MAFKVNTCRCVNRACSLDFCLQLRVYNSSYMLTHRLLHKTSKNNSKKKLDMLILCAIAISDTICCDRVCSYPTPVLPAGRILLSSPSHAHLLMCRWISFICIDTTVAVVTNESRISQSLLWNCNSFLVILKHSFCFCRRKESSVFIPSHCYPPVCACVRVCLYIFLREIQFGVWPTMSGT